MIFDVLRVHGEDVMQTALGERRAILEQLNLEGPAWSTPDTFEDGLALYQAVCERGLEGIVAKSRRGRYRPGERVWLKIKNPGYWRRESERAAMRRAATRPAVA
jgi:bifunctional non-homologous end joining protein LigD